MAENVNRPDRSANFAFAVTQRYTTIEFLILGVLILYQTPLSRNRIHGRAQRSHPNLLAERCRSPPYHVALRQPGGHWSWGDITTRFPRQLVTLVPGTKLTPTEAFNQ